MHTPWPASLTSRGFTSTSSTCSCSASTAREKAALQYADKFATDHYSIDDEAIAQLRAHFSEAEIVELGMYCGYFLGIGRFLASLDIVEELPADMQDKSKWATPWQTRSAVVVAK